INFPAKINQRFALLKNEQCETTVKLLSVGGLRETTGFVTDLFARNNSEFVKINDKSIALEEVVYIEDEYVYFAEQDKHNAFLELTFENCSPIIPSEGKKVNHIDLSDSQTLDPTPIIENSTDEWQALGLGGYLE